MMDEVITVAGAVGANLGAILEAGVVVVAAASAVCAATPTPSDDILIGKIYRVIEALAFNFGHAKEQPPNRAARPRAVRPRAEG
jgi:hypothetical protein